MWCSSSHPLAPRDCAGIKAQFRVVNSSMRLSPQMGLAVAAGLLGLLLTLG